MFKDVMIASESDLESQIEALLPGSDPDVHVKDGLTFFTQYVYFRLQYWCSKYPHRWPIAKHECLQSIQGLGITDDLARLRVLTLERTLCDPVARALRQPFR